MCVLSEFYCPTNCKVEAVGVQYLGQEGYERLHLFEGGWCFYFDGKKTR